MKTASEALCSAEFGDLLVDDVIITKDWRIVGMTSAVPALER